MTEQAAKLVQRKLESLDALLSVSLELWKVEGEVARNDAGILIRRGPIEIGVRQEPDNPVAAWWVTLESQHPPARMRECPCSGCLGVLNKVYEWLYLDG